MARSNSLIKTIKITNRKTKLAGDWIPKTFAAHIAISGKTLMMNKSAEKAEYYVTPEENITLAPGAYYIGIALLDATGDEQKVLFPMFVKKSFVIEKDSSELQPVSYNIGLSVAGRKIK